MAEPSLAIAVDKIAEELIKVNNFNCITFQFNAGCLWVISMIKFEKF